MEPVKSLANALQEVRHPIRWDWFIPYEVLSDNRLIRYRPRFPWSPLRSPRWSPC